MGPIHQKSRKNHSYRIFGITDVVRTYCHISFIGHPASTGTVDLSPGVNSPNREKFLDYIKTIIVLA